MIVDRIRSSIAPGTSIPKPEQTDGFVVKMWGRRRGEPALIYQIPSRTRPAGSRLKRGKPYEKGITETEFELAYEELQRSGHLRRAWFSAILRGCAKESGCNFTRKRIQLEIYRQNEIDKKKELAAERARRRTQGVSIGMTKEEVLMSNWGKPRRINSTTTSRGTREQWVYGGGNYLYFNESGRLTTIQN